MFRNYLREEKHGPLFFFATALSVAAAAGLYMPRAEFLYTVLVLLTGLCLYTALDYFRYRAERLRLGEILDAPPQGTAEEDVAIRIAELEAAREECTQRAEERARHTREYMTVWSHQLKSPLFALRLLIPDEESEPEEMLAEVFRMENYVDSLLGYYRLESDSTDYVFRNEALAPMLGAIVQKYRAAARLSGNDLSLSVAEVSIVTDPKWFAFMIEQVLSNAIKYTRGGQIAITQTEGILTVSDSGIGIAATDLPRLFEAGFTGENGRTRDRATGMGLYLVQRIGRALNIPVAVRSRAGKGTAVDFDLSAVLEEERRGR